jgi:hypothetical protein
MKFRLFTLYREERIAPHSARMRLWRGTTVRELVARTLHQLQVEGFLEVNGRTIIVKSLAGLRREQTSSK